MNTFGDRLREERDRLGMSQTTLAEIGGVKKGAQINYEKSAREPGVNYLVAVGAVGVDVQYVLTGQRQSPEVAEQFRYAAAFAAKRGDATSSALLLDAFRKHAQTTLDRKELELVAQLRELSPAQQALVAQTVATLHASSAPPSEAGDEGKAKRGRPRKA